MDIGSSQNGRRASEQAQLQIDHVRVSRTRTRLMAYSDGKLIHQHELNMGSAVARGRFAKRVAERTGLDQQQLDEELLAIAAGLAELYADDDEGVDILQYQINDAPEDPDRRGLYHGANQLTNFTLEVIEDVLFVDDIESRREFRCRAELDGTPSEFTIAAKDFANNLGLSEAVFAAVGPKARILCKPHVLRTAVSAVSKPVQRTFTTNFGWTKEGDTFLTPSVRIDASGVHPVDPADPSRVDLSDEQCARHLDLAAPEPGELLELKKHLVNSFLPLHTRRVTYTLLAAAALAVLFRFVKGKNRPGLWLVGRTGGGKSFVARLVMGLFGDFPLSDGGRLGSWTSTGKFLQRAGYFFKDALFLVDDFKPELISHREVLALLQNYADGAGRGRLKVDATANVTRPIRGILLSTGEDTPEHSASAVARNVIIPVPSAPKDITRSRRCLKQCGRYRVVMAAFVHHLLLHNRTNHFDTRVEDELQFFYTGIEGQENDLRIAANFALLAVAFREFAAFLSDVWPGWQQSVDDYITQDLVALRDEMLALVRQQQACEVFLAALKMLVLNGRVQIISWHPTHVIPERIENKPIVGRLIPAISPAARQATGPVFDIATSLALEAVQGLLRGQGKPPLAVTEKALIQQLAGAGMLLDKTSHRIAPESGGDHTWAAKVAGATKNVFRISACELLGKTPTSA